MANEAGMAAILGHEVAHAVARHGAERMSQRMSMSAIKEAVSFGLPFGGLAATGVMTAFGLGAEVGVLLPYSRTHEQEADILGLLYAARAGYDPAEAILFWERMREAKGDKGVEFLSTHPSKEHRIEDLEEYLPQALEAYHQAPQQFGLGESW
jgi:predicted Zn-dependent protease